MNLIQGSREEVEIWRYGDLKRIELRICGRQHGVFAREAPGDGRTYLLAPRQARKLARILVGQVTKLGLECKRRPVSEDWTENIPLGRGTGHKLAEAARYLCPMTMHRTTTRFAT